MHAQVPKEDAEVEYNPRMESVNIFQRIKVRDMGLLLMFLYHLPGLEELHGSFHLLTLTICLLAHRACIPDERDALHHWLSFYRRLHKENLGSSTKLQFITEFFRLQQGQDFTPRAALTPTFLPTSQADKCLSGLGV